MKERFSALPGRCALSYACGTAARIAGFPFRTILRTITIVFLLSATALAAGAEDRSGIEDEFYDSVARGFVTQYQEGYAVVADVPNGMLSRGAVSIYCAEGSAVAFYRNGEPYKPETSGNRYDFRQIGAYTVVIADPFDSERPTRLFTFRLVGEETTDINVLSFPTCVKVLEVTRDGESLELGEAIPNGVLDAREKGTYKITWQVEGGTSQSLSFRRIEKKQLCEITTGGVSAKVSFFRGLDSIRIFRKGTIVYAATGGAWSDEFQSWVLAGSSNEGTESTLNSFVTLSRPGIYTILAYGSDGSAELKTVRVYKQRDAAGVLSILMLGATLVVVRIFLLYDKRGRAAVR